MEEESVKTRLAPSYELSALEMDEALWDAVHHPTAFGERICHQQHLG